MNEYLFLYRGSKRPSSPQEAQEVMQLWMAWMQDLAKRGHMKDRGQPIFEYEPDDFAFEAYEPHPHISAPVAV